MSLSADQIARCFTAPGGAYAFARWSRPIAPVAFGITDDSLSYVKAAVRAIAGISGHPTADTDPETGANLLFFFLRDWHELLSVPTIGDLLPDPARLVARLVGAGGDQFRHFAVSPGAGIRYAVAAVNLSGAPGEADLGDLMLQMAVLTHLDWTADLPQLHSVLVRGQGGDRGLNPDLARLMRAAYDPGLPATADDPAHALRLAARMGGV